MMYKLIYNQDMQNDFKWILNELFGETTPINDSIEKKANEHLENFKIFKWPVYKTKSLDEIKATPK